MLLAQAHSFRQQARLAVTLAGVAGYTNILTLLVCGVVTSHLSGAASHLGHSAAALDWSEGAGALTLLISFLLGAMLSGICTETGRRRGWESIYILPMAIEAALLASFAVALEWFDGGLKGSKAAGAIPVVAALAMGLQNATITRISNGVVRTTHMTGVVTDLGLELAQFLLWTRDRRRNSPPGEIRGAIRSLVHHPEGRRLALLTLLLGSFVAGAAFGSFAHGWSPRWAMLPPVILLLWIVYQDISRPIAEIQPSDLAESGGIDLPGGMAIFHLRKTTGEGRRPRRMPNLLNWLDFRCASARVVVLDLGLESRFEKEAVLELRAAVLKCKLSGRRLILGGVGREQLRLLRQDWGEDLHPEDVFQDLDLAIAHAINVAEAAEAGRTGGN